MATVTPIEKATNSYYSHYIIIYDIYQGENSSWK